LDEAPFTYKDIELVMQSQKALVDVVGKFTPKIVKMWGAETNRTRKNPPTPKEEQMVEGD
jgi:tRNA-splicing ligase RtcB (3'-phosphate/5'-hydroxy nucleic acid ligase)